MQLVHLCYDLSYCHHTFSFNPFLPLTFSECFTDIFEPRISLVSTEWLLHVFKDTFEIGSNYLRLCHCEDEIIVSQGKMLLEAVHHLHGLFVLLFEEVFDLQACGISQEVLIDPNEHKGHLDIFVITCLYWLFPVETSQRFPDDVVRADTGVTSAGAIVAV